MHGGKTSISRLPVKTNLLEVPSTSTRDSRSMIRSRASSTSRVSVLTIGESPAFRRSKSSQSLYRTCTILPGLNCRTPITQPQSVLRGSRQRSADRPKHKKKEGRPLHDKKWQQQQIAKTQAYFQNVPGGCTFLNKGTNLRPITLNMFVELTNLVLSNIDPSLNELRLANYTDLLPTYLTMLMYPGAVTVSMLKTANTMHSWPHVLGILSWLVELEELHNTPVEDIVFEIPDDAPPEYKTVKYSWSIVVDTFIAWNSQQLDEDQLMRNYEEGLNIIYNVPIGEVNNLDGKIKKKNEYYLNLKEQFQEQSIQLKANQDELNVMKNDHHNAKTIYSQQKNYNNRIMDVIVDSKNDIIKLQKEIEKIRNNNIEFTEKIAKQPMTKFERDKKMSVIEDLKAKLAMIKKSRAHQYKIGDEKDLKLSQMKRNLEQKTNAYNISLMQPILQYPALKDLNLPRDGFIRPDVMQLIDNKLEQKKALIAQLTTGNEHLVSNINILKTKVENKQEELDDLLVLKEKKKKTNDELKFKLSILQKAALTQDSIAQSKIGKLKAEIKELANALENPEYKILVPKLKMHVDKCKWWEKYIVENQGKFVHFYKRLEELADNHILKVAGFRIKIDKAVDETIEIYSEPKCKKNTEIK